MWPCFAFSFVFDQHLHFPVVLFLCRFLFFICVFNSIGVFKSICYLKLCLFVVPLLLFPYFLLPSFQTFWSLTTRPEDQRTTGPEHSQRTTRPEDHRTRGPQDKRTTGPEDHRTRGLQDQGSLNFFSRGCKYFFQGTWIFFPGNLDFFSSIIPLWLIN